MLAPAGAIVLAVVGFHLLGEGLRDALDRIGRPGYRGSSRTVESSLVAAAIALVALGGCRGPLEAPIPAARTRRRDTASGGTLHLATFGDVTTLDPVTARTASPRASFASFTRASSTSTRRGHVVPDLADEIDLPDGGRTYRFTLRERAASTTEPR